MRVAILGVGTVGQSVANILEKNKKIIKARSGKEITPVIGVVKDLSKKRNVNLELTDDIDSVINRDDIDIFIELMGGVEKPFDIVKALLHRKKAVVTANKAMLAYHRYALQDVAGNTPLGFEASVAGGIPIIKALREGLSANHISLIQGILNGTSNFILTKMMNTGSNFLDVLKEAQKLGYAEADPKFDVGGFDAAHKLLILASIAFGTHGNPEDILIEGIENINQDDIYFAKEFDYVIKLLGIAKKVNNKIELRVHPAMVPADNMIAKVSGVMNGVSVIGDWVGETMYYGAGAGGDATASAVISDLIDIARNTQGYPMLGFKQSLETGGLSLASKEDIHTKYYMRIKVVDKSGVLAKIANVLEQKEISVESFIQKQEQENSIATLLFATHKSREKNIKEALEELLKMDFVKEKPAMIRIED